MAAAAAGSKWLRGKVKAVPSGDSLVIVGNTKADVIPPEKTITLSSLTAPRLARRGGVDEPFAWDSREYLRKLCIGKEVTFKVDYVVPSIGREFGSVFLGDKNVAMVVVSQGWAKVREQGQQKGEASPYLAELLRLEEQAKQLGVGRWSKTPGASEAAVRNLPPSAIGDPSNLDAMGLLAANKGTPMQAIVEQVRDGSTVRVYLLPEFQFVQVFVAGVQAPSMGRRAVVETVVEPEMTSDDQNGETASEPRGQLTTAQKLAASAASVPEVAPDAFAREAKHFTETRLLNRDVRIVLEGVDKFSNLIGSVYYPDGDTAKDLALELVENGYAKFVEWSANMMEEDAKRRLKSAELQAKKDRLRIWTNYVPPASNSKAIHNQNFTGTVVEIVSGDCVVVADDAVPYGSPSAERRVNLSSIRCPKIGNPRRDEKPAPYAREAKELLRQRLIGRQVDVSMEYSRKVSMAEGAIPAAGSSDTRVMDFGSVFLLSPSKSEAADAPTAAATAGGQHPGINIAELVLSRGFGTVIRHRDFEERSNHYDALLAAESRAIAQKKGIHSARDPPVVHHKDLTTTSAKKAKDFLPFLQRGGRQHAVVEYVLSGHRFKLFISKETCSVAFSLSGVRCPGRDEPYSDDAIAFMRRKILQRDVEIEVETADRTGTFIGSLWESRTNIGAVLLEAGLARLQTSFGLDRIADAALLKQAEESAKRKNLKIWENYVEGQEVSNGSVPESRQKDVIPVVVTEVLGGGKFYVQTVGDQMASSIQQQLASLSLGEAPVIGSFNPKKGDLILAQFTADNSWSRHNLASLFVLLSSFPLLLMAYPISPSTFPPPRSPLSVDSNLYHLSFRNLVFISSQRNSQILSFSPPISGSPVSTICCCHGKSSEPSSPSDDGRWDLPLHQFLRTAVQKFDAFVKSRMNSQSTKNAAMEEDEQRQNEVEKLKVEEDDADSWDWERWQKYFMEVEEQERLVSILKSQLKHAVDNEDFEEAARLKVAIAAVATRNTVGSVMSFLNRAIEEEQYKDAAFVRDNAGAGLVGWWAGVSDDSSDPYGCIIRISPEHGRYVARSYNPRQLATSKVGAPLFEIFMTMDKKGQYKQQAVYLKRVVASQSVASAFAKSSEATGSLKSPNASLSRTDLVDPAVPVIEDAAADEDRDDSDADALSGFQNILQDMIPGVRVKVLEVIMPEKVDQDSVSKVIGQLMDEEDGEKVAGLNGENLEDGDESDGGEQKDDIEVDAATKNIDHEEQSKIGIQVVVDGLVEKLPGSVLSKELLRVPAKLEKKGRRSFSLIINNDNNERVSGGKNLNGARRKAKGQQNAERLIFDLAKLISRGEKIPPKVLKDVGNLIDLGISQAKNRQPLSRSTTFNRIELPTYSDPFNGLYVGSHGPFSSEVIQMRRRFGQWKEDSETKESSKLEFYEYVEAVKITGDPYVPAGQVAFRAKVGKRYQLPHKEIIPAEFGVIARYKGQGRLSGPGFHNPRWVDGELIVLDGKYIKAGPVVGFVYWAPEYQFLVFFQRLRIQD